MLTREKGEAAAEPQAACVLDLKRSYIENPDATHLYVATSDAEGRPEWGPLGFRAEPSLSVPELSREGGPHATFCLEFGAGGIFGWIGRLVDAQYEMPSAAEAVGAFAAPSAATGLGLRFDEEQRHVVVDGVDVVLTPLQFNLLRHFARNAQRVVGRDELLQAVWGRPFVGSNVVDAAIRSLRKKLGAHATAIETVKGFGYRFHPR